LAATFAKAAPTGSGGKGSSSAKPNALYTSLILVPPVT
jgi:hypothetical protein